MECFKVAASQVLQQVRLPLNHMKHKKGEEEKKQVGVVVGDKLHLSQGN
jgi:hypothetical protein